MEGAGRGDEGQVCGEAAQTKAQCAVKRRENQKTAEFGKRWKALSAEDKAPFEAQASAAKETFVAQLAELAAQEVAVAAWKRGGKASKATAELKGPQRVAAA